METKGLANNRKHANQMSRENYLWTHATDQRHTYMWHRDGTIHEDSDVEVCEEHWTNNQYKLTPEDVRNGWLVDIGANIGAISAWWLTYGGTAIAVEPEPWNQRILGINTTDALLANPAAKLKKLGIAISTPGVSQVMLKGGGASARIDNDGTPVPAAPLPTIIKPKTKISVLKIDVEGHEHAIIGTLPEGWLKACRRIIIELHTSPAPDAYANIIDIISKTHQVTVENKILQAIRIGETITPDLEDLDNYDTEKDDDA